MSSQNSKRPKAPTRRRPLPEYGWSELPSYPTADGVFERFIHHQCHLVVISSVSWTEAPTRNECWHWIVSASYHGQSRLPTDSEMAFIRQSFNMKEAEEDNHVEFHIKVHGAPPKTRKLWLPEPASERGICPCADDNDQQIIEDAGSKITVDGHDS